MARLYSQLHYIDCCSYLRCVIIATITVSWVSSQGRAPKAYWGLFSTQPLTYDRDRLTILRAEEAHLTTGGTVQRWLIVAQMWALSQNIFNIRIYVNETWGNSGKIKIKCFGKFYFVYTFYMAVTILNSATNEAHIQKEYCCIIMVSTEMGCKNISYFISVFLFTYYTKC